MGCSCLRCEDGRRLAEGWPPIRRIFDGETVVVVASGPSAGKVEIEAAKGEARVIAINNSWRLAPWADVLYACDGRWWQHYEPDYHGLKITSDERAADYGAVHVRGEQRPGLSLDPALIHYNMNSGFQALNLAYHFGAARVLLVGFDMQAADGRRHWHGDHPRPLNNPQESAFAQWRKPFDTAAAQLKEHGIEVLNCSPGSALKAFPMADFEGVLEND